MNRQNQNRLRHRTDGWLPEGVGVGLVKKVRY